jgi:hypothetical protein
MAVLNASRTRSLVVCSLTAFVALICFAGIAAAQPAPFPTLFSGSVTLNGQPAPVGTAITFSAGGAQCGSGEVETAGSYSIAATCPAGSVTILVNGKSGGSATVASGGGGSQTVDLTVTTATATPSPTPTRTATPIPATASPTTVQTQSPATTAPTEAATQVVTPRAPVTGNAGLASDTSDDAQLWMFVGVAVLAVTAGAVVFIAYRLPRK